MAMADSLDSEVADWFSSFDFPLQGDELLSSLPLLHDMQAMDFSDLLCSPTTNFAQDITFPATDRSLSLSDFFIGEGSPIVQAMTSAAEPVNPFDCTMEPQSLGPDVEGCGSLQKASGTPSIEQVFLLADGMPSDPESDLADLHHNARKPDLQTPDLHENSLLVMSSESSTDSSERPSMERSGTAPASSSNFGVGYTPSFSAKQESVPKAHGSSSDPSQKKQSRLRRNRELAFESRQRKKSYIKDLETKCKMLEKERNLLQQQTSVICTENSILREEVTRLKKMKGSNGVAEPAVLADSLPLEFLLHLTCLSLMAWVLLFKNSLLTLLIGAFLQSFEVTEGGLAKERAYSKFYTHPSDILVRGLDAPEFQLPSHEFVSSMEQRAHSFWRRRIRSIVCVTCKTVGHLIYCCRVL